MLTLLLSAQLHFKYQLPQWLIAYYLVLNVFTFFIYCYDKSAACKGNWRIREAHLHVFSLFGGWWGALIAQQFIRHKSIKKSFLVVFTLTIFIHIAVVIAVYLNWLI